MNVVYHLGFNCKPRFCMLGFDDNFGNEYFLAIEGIGPEVHKESYSIIIAHI